MKAYALLEYRGDDDNFFADVIAVSKDIAAIHRKQDEILKERYKLPIPVDEWEYLLEQVYSQYPDDNLDILEIIHNIKPNYSLEILEKQAELYNDLIFEPDLSIVETDFIE